MGNANNKTLEIPQTFREMCALNAGMTGANVSYVAIVEQGFERLVIATTNGDQTRVELETNIMALRIHKDVEGKFALSEFKLCMLASLRSLLPKSWSTAHEQAWIAMWDRVEQILAHNIGLPAKYEKAVERAVQDMSDDDKKEFGLNAFNRLFAKQPNAEYHFNTSNARLSILATNVLQICVEMYKDPTRTEQTVISLGLRHIMYDIAAEYFEPFTEAIVAELRTWMKDPIAPAGVGWVLTQISGIMLYTLEEGSNPLLRAVIKNSPAQVKKALAPLARQDRANACIGVVIKF